LGKIKLLGIRYDYYSVIKEKTDKIAVKIYKINDEIFKSRLYNLVLNMCNQFIFDYTYVFTTRDLYFIADYNINVNSILEEFKEDIVKMRKISKK